jgi:hypothetical protein
VTRAERRRLERQAANRAARERGVEVAEETEERPKEARSRHQLDALAADSLISEMQAKAGDRFYRDYRAGGSLTCLKLPPYQFGAKLAKGAPPSTDDHPWREAARLRFEMAQAALGPRERALVLHVCVCDQPLATWRPPIGFGRTPALELLRAGLDGLVVHYGWASSRGLAA